MKTNKIMTVFVTALLAVSFMVPLVLAQDEVIAEDDASDELVIAADTLEEVELEDAGVGPDSVFYGLDRAMERISLALTFDKVKKAEKALRNAEERLAEVREMIQAKRLDKADKAQKFHDEAIEEAGEIVDGIESNGDEEEAEKALEKVYRVREKIKSHSEKVALVKERILARQANKMTEEQIAHMREVFSKIEAKASETESRMEQKRENVRTKYKVQAGLTDEELEEVEEGLTEQTEEQRRSRANSESNRN